MGVDSPTQDPGPRPAPASEMGAVVPPWVHLRWCPQTVQLRRVGLLFHGGQVLSGHLKDETQHEGKDWPGAVSTLYLARRWERVSSHEAALASLLGRKMSEPVAGPRFTIHPLLAPPHPRHHRPFAKLPLLLFREEKKALLVLEGCLSKMPEITAGSGGSQSHLS